MDLFFRSNFSQFNFLENDHLSGEEGGLKRQYLLFGKGPVSFSVQVFLLEDCDGLKCRNFEWSSKLRRRVMNKFSVGKIDQFNKIVE